MAKKETTKKGAAKKTTKKAPAKKAAAKKEETTAPALQFKVGMKVEGILNDGKNTKVEGKILKINSKGKAVVEIPDRGTCIIPLHALAKAVQKKAKTKSKAA